MQEKNSIDSGIQIIIVGDGTISSFTSILYISTEQEKPSFPLKNLNKEKIFHICNDKLNKKSSNIKPSSRLRKKTFSFKRENYTHGKPYTN
jgi:hypothetical protein